MTSRIEELVEALVRGPRTAETHVSKILASLAIQQVNFIKDLTIVQVPGDAADGIAFKQTYFMLQMLSILTRVPAKKLEDEFSTYVGLIIEDMT